MHSWEVVSRGTTGRKTGTHTYKSTKHVFYLIGAWSEGCGTVVAMKMTSWFERVQQIEGGRGVGGGRIICIPVECIQAGGGGALSYISGPVPAIIIRFCWGSSRGGNICVSQGDRLRTGCKAALCVRVWVRIA